MAIQLDLHKWERVSDLKFMHGDECLTPYPFVCTIYVELNSSKQNKCEGKFKEILKNCLQHIQYSRTIKMLKICLCENK
ncbi:putative protein C11orf85, partial [Ophiophagus hannah]